MKKTTEQFVSEAKNKHGYRYDYSLADYQGCKVKIKIVCPEHGVFEQESSSHLSGRGCRKCGRLVVDKASKIGAPEFISKAREKHGDRYDYSLVEYHNSKVKIKIVCPVHGVFEQSPDGHLQSSGCPKCAEKARAEAKKKDTLWFISEAIKIHGDRYGYSLVDYHGSQVKIKILCTEHGMFEQAPTGHLSGRGCRKCADKANSEAYRKDTFWFISKAREKHGDRYGYSLVDYHGSQVKIKILCTEHGVFEQAPDGHLSGRGCRKCVGKAISKASKKDLKWFISKAREKHADIYDYSMSDYQGTKEKIKIICSVHGIFEQKAEVHLIGKGCNKCGILRMVKARKKDHDLFVSEAREKHGTKYDYSLVKYESTHVKVKIICRVHDVFEQMPSGHLSGKGCRKCADKANSEAYKQDTQLFISKARKKHGDRYDYSKSDYRGCKVKIKIICPVHKVFEQNTTVHLRGSGCRKCADKVSSEAKTKDTQWFISKARKKHGDRYDYSMSDYQGCKDKIKIICPVHDVFEQDASGHLGGAGCMKCGRILNVASRKKSIEVFLSEAREKHGDKYDYSLVEYENTSTKVKIICPEHGVFEQEPQSHAVVGHGCSTCGYIEMVKARKKSTEQFISEAINKHGNIFDYSLVEYEKSDIKVKIICHYHGEFEQAPNNHLQGSGCQLCGYISNAESQRGNKEEFILAAINKHGNKYDYSMVEYKNSNTKIHIICPNHGVFEQVPDSHTNAGSGCMSCGFISSAEGCRLDTKTFIDRALSIHGKRYDYSKSVYEDSNKYVTITCFDHGDFKQSPSNHYKYGCNQCGIESTANKRRKSLDSFISEANKFHGYKYSYSGVDYVNYTEKVKIFCPDHGEFYITAGNHLAGKGCSSCSYYGFRPNRPSAIYILSSDCGGHIKVGISNNPANRAFLLRGKTPFDFKIMDTLWTEGKKVVALEKQLHSMLESSGFYGFDWCTEWFIFNKKAAEILIKTAKFPPHNITHMLTKTLNKH